MKNKEIKINLEVYGSSSEMSAQDSDLVQRAKLATENAYAPYSNFQVGAAVLLENGEVITGSNQENAAYPSGLCAERTALFYAGAKFPNVAVKSIAIAAQTGGQFCAQSVYPCGACRQVMLENEMRGRQPIRVIMAGENEVEVVRSAHDLLPLSFDELKK
ncbi:MAG: cytidine deaminase [Prevotellaceae bacterium]|jgi:cytidine deaminase|nr:cytidine deaminase [Prevotellaceae bacterium]